MSSGFYQRYYDEIERLVIPPGAEKGTATLKISTTPIDWDWPKSPGFIQEAEYMTLGYMPQSDDGKFYIRSSRDFFSAYQEVLTCVKLFPDRYDDSIKELDLRVQTSKKNLEEEITAMNQQLKEARTDLPGLDPETWIKLTGWNDTIKHCRDVKRFWEDQSMEMLRQWNRQHLEAIDASTMDVDKPGFVKCITNSSSRAQRPNFQVSANGMEWAKKVSTEGGEALQIKILTSDVESDASNFFSLYSMTDPTKTWNLHECKAEVTIRFEAFKIVSVSPDVSWYRSGYLSKIAAENCWNKPFTSETIFGSGGLLHSMITGFIAVYQPSIRVHVSRFNTGDSRDVSSKLLKAVTQCKVGPLLFDIPQPTPRTSASAGIDEVDWREQVDDDTFSMKSTSQYPQIIGFLVDKPVIL